MILLIIIPIISILIFIQTNVNCDIRIIDTLTTSIIFQFIWILINTFYFIFPQDIFESLTNAFAVINIILFIIVIILYMNSISFFN